MIVICLVLRTHPKWKKNLSPKSTKNSKFAPKIKLSPKKIMKYITSKYSTKYQLEMDQITDFLGSGMTDLFDLYPAWYHFYIRRPI